MNKTTDPVVAIETVRLTALVRYLNKAYGTALATLAPSRSSDDPAFNAPLLTVQRGRTAADVVVAATWNEDRFIVAVYTSTSWYSHGEPFHCDQFTLVRNAAQYAAQYIPFHPAT